MKMSSSSTDSAQLAFALKLTQRIGLLQLDFYKRGVDVYIKTDGSPVTRVDRESESAIRQAIMEQYPEDEIIGEEEGVTAGNSDSAVVGDISRHRRWLIDPIDGTANFIRGMPIFSTLLALEHDGEVVLGIINAPAMGDTFWAEKGRGAYKNGERLSTSTVVDISQAQFFFGEPKNILRKGYQPGLNRIIEKTSRHRAFGDYLNFGYVFEGKAEGALEVGVHPWDLAPMKILSQESGGKYSDLAGGQSIYTGDCLVSNAHLHADFLALLGKSSG